VNDVTVFDALADSTRRQLLMTLAKESPKTATQLARQYPISRPGIIKHLNILQEAGLVTRYQKGREKRYVLAPEPLSELEEWLDEINDVWVERLERLKGMLESEE
jgi:DNA-binding transcriptional ArsR family regulator